MSLLKLATDLQAAGVVADAEKHRRIGVTHGVRDDVEILDGEETLVDGIGFFQELEVPAGEHLGHVRFEDLPIPFAVEVIENREPTPRGSSPPRLP